MVVVVVTVVVSAAAAAAADVMLGSEEVFSVLSEIAM